jgi:hypothetical protein
MRSGRVQEDILGRLPLSFEDRGEHHVKNIVRPIRVYAFGAKTIGELPSIHGFTKEEGGYSEEPRRWLELPGPE